MKRKILTSFTVGIMCFSLASCGNADNTDLGVRDTTDSNEMHYESIDWEDDPTIGTVQAGYYKRVGVSKEVETYEEMRELLDVSNKGYLVVCDDGTATFELDGETVDYLYDQYNFYLSEDSGKTNGIPYVYIGGRIIVNDGSVVTQYLKLSDEELDSYLKDGGRTIE